MIHPDRTSCFPVQEGTTCGVAFAVANGLEGKLSVIGYFRSDTREGVRLYEDDLALIRELFADHSNVFLVVRPSEVPHPAAGFFFWEGDRIFSSFSFMEFSFHEDVLTSDAYDSATEPDGNSSCGKQSGAVVPVSGADNGFKPSPAPVDETRIHAAKDRMPSRRWPVAAGIAILLGLGAYFVPRIVRLKAKSWRNRCLPAPVPKLPRWDYPFPDPEPISP